MRPHPNRRRVREASKEGEPHDVAHKAPVHASRGQAAVIQIYSIKKIEALLGLSVYARAFTLERLR